MKLFWRLGAYCLWYVSGVGILIGIQFLQEHLVVGGTVLLFSPLRAILIWYDIYYSAVPWYPVWVFVLNTLLFGVVIALGFICRYKGKEVGRKLSMNWFHRHLNWTLALPGYVAAAAAWWLAFIIVWPGSIFVALFYYGCLIWVILWYLRQKGRRWLHVFWLFLPLGFRYLNQVGGAFGGSTVFVLLYYAYPLSFLGILVILLLLRNKKMGRR